MAQVIEGNTILATDTDVLSGGRLITLPGGSELIVEVLADLNNATNNFVVDLSLPGGEAPWIGVPVPGANPSLGGVIDDRQVLRGRFIMKESGHATLGLTETGAAIATWRVVSIS